ncbi:MAG: dihydrofolate reductase family protein, partial [Chloroflexi bacterium]|nr:dihydrofolate reductase family protein [Chloroflexota bacterium]
RAERRARGLEENPTKVGVVANATLDPDSRFLTAGPARVMLFTTTQTDPAQIARLHERGAQVIVMGEQQVDLAGVLQRLKAEDVNRLLVEGGGTLNAGLLKQRLVDEIYLYIAPLIFGGANAPTFAGGAGLAREDAIQLQLDSVVDFGDGGIVVHYLVTKD